MASMGGCAGCALSSWGTPTLRETYDRCPTKAQILAQVWFDMITYNHKEKIVEHYNLVSPYYYALWGEHVHHGYWTTGRETKEEAQLALTEHLAHAATIKRGSKILDVGCGFGASSLYLAQKYQAETTGITISPVQVQMAQAAAAQAGVPSQFVLMDADALHFDEVFDVIWSIESISHYTDKPTFFKQATQLLKPHGTMAVTDWFKKENLSEAEYAQDVVPIEKGMLVALHTMTDYACLLKSNGLSIVKSEDLSKQTSKTWDISLEIVKNKMLWQLALQHGTAFIHFLESFRAMKQGFASGNFVYGLIVARKA
jgi:tocopherol O-methyltransferase